MRYFYANAAVLACALFLSSSALLGNCSLASYSETRSFRDALDGRSMEDAISGPVDRDTSSYGDRTSASPAATFGMTVPANGNLNNNNNNMVRQQQQQQQQQPQQEVNPDEQQQRQTSGPELEREAGSSNGMSAGQSPMNNNDNNNEQQQQQLMEQKSAKSQRAPSNGNRLSSNGNQAMSPMVPTGAGMRSSRQQFPQQQQQQQQQSEGDFGTGGSTKGATTGTRDSSFGEEPANSGKRSRKQGELVQPQQQPLGYGGQQNRANGGQRPPMNGGGSDGTDNNDDQQQQPQQQQLQSPEDQQVMRDNGDGGQREPADKSYANAGNADDQQMAAKQRAMDAMLMSMNNGMKYSRLASPASNKQAMNGQPQPQQQQQQAANKRASFGDKNASSMAQNMIASLANKAAYMEMQQQKMQQRQLASQAPPMVISMIPQTSGYQKQAQQAMGSGGNGYNGPMMMMGNMNGGGNGGSGMRRGGLRRANQRKVDKKMSPAMVNAMLNKMLSMKQKEQEEAAGSSNGYGSPKPTSVAMLMKSPAGAEMLANMVMPQMAGAMADMPQAKKEQYKRIMMAAIMQQAEASGANAANGGLNSGAQEQRQEPEAESYGQQQQQQQQMIGTGNGNKLAQANLAANGAASKLGLYSRNGPNATAGANGMMTTTTPVAMMLNMMAKSSQKPNGGYDDSSAQQFGRPLGNGPMMSAGRNGQQYADRLGAAGNAGKTSSRSGKPTMGSANGFGQTQSYAQMEPSAKQEQQQQQSMGGAGGAGAGYQNGDQREQRELSALGMQQAPLNGLKGSTMGGRAQVTGRPMSMQIGSAGYPGGPGQSGMMPGMKLNGGGARPANGKYAEQMGQREAFRGNNDVEQQQRDMLPATMTPSSMMSQTKSPLASDNGEPTTGYSRDGADQMGAGLPMNGFRQAFEDQQQEQRMFGDSNNNNNNNNNRGSTSSSPSTMSTKGQADSYPSSGSMARSKPMQQSYGQQPDSDQQQQQLQDEYGAAPMGMAEPFAFDYKIEDDYGNGQYRKEESDKNGVVRGSYGYTDVSGIYRHVEYVADENGFRANIKSNEPGLSSETATNDDTNNNGNSNDNNRSTTGNGGSERDSQPISATNIDPSDQSNGANINQPQQQQQQQQQLQAPMMMPSQTEWNENGEN